MIELLAGLNGPGEIEEEIIPPRRCAFHKPAAQTEVSYLKDLRSFQIDEHGRLIETVSKSGFRTQFAYRDVSTLEMRGYQVFDPNMVTFERAIRHADGRWIIERLNPAKGRMELVPNTFEHVSLDKSGNVNRIDRLGKVHVLNVRIERQQMLNSLVEFAWQI